ncbi:MAG: PqqD family protein [Gammaproteobacteria bacterium]
MLKDEHFRLDADILFRAVGNEGVVVDQRGPSVLVVNAVALRILELIRDSVSTAVIVSTLCCEFDAGPERIEEDVAIFLDELKKRAILH